MEFSDFVTPVTGLLSGLGIGAVLTNGIQYLLKQRELSALSQRADLEQRYRVVILLMYAAHDFSVNETAFRINRPDLKNREQVLEELKAEWHNMLLFASDATLTALHAFIVLPSLEALKKAAIAMRNDLGRGKISKSIDGIRF